VDKEAVMSEKTITYTVENRIALVTIDNPPMNALSWQVLDEIYETFTAIDRDDGIKAVVFSGAGKAFIAGADIRMLKETPGEKEALENTKKYFHRTLNYIEEMRKPVIAAIHGYCLGGGLEVALACHMRIAGEKAQFGVPEIKLGIFPGAGGTQRLPRVAGKAKALEMILTGEFISAQEALQWGIVNKVVPQDQVQQEARVLAEKIVSKGQVAVRWAMEVVIEGLKGDLQRGLDLEATYFAKLFETEDMKEGMAAFLEKREPRFKDR
jgi:enoyl-CoA hydratase/carnithine racemase